MRPVHISMFASIIAVSLLASEAVAQRQGRPPRPRGHEGQAADGAQNAQRGRPPRADQQSGRQQQMGASGGRSQTLDATQVAVRMMQNFDADGDGTLNSQELLAGLTALQQSLQQRQPGVGQTQSRNRNNAQARGSSRNNSQAGPSRGPSGGQQDGRRRGR